MSEKWHKLTAEDCKKLFNGWLEGMADGKGEIYNRVERLVGEDIDLFPDGSKSSDGLDGSEGSKNSDGSEGSDASEVSMDDDYPDIWTNPYNRHSRKCVLKMMLFGEETIIRSTLDLIEDKW